MNWILFHIISGQSYFTGIALVVAAVQASCLSVTSFQRLSVFIFLIGVIAVAVSSTPIPNWYYALVVVITLVWLVACKLRKAANLLRYLTVAVWLLAAMLELPFHRTPSLSLVKNRALTVIGDSVTAGIGGSEYSQTWPSLFAKQHQIDVQDFSHVGETAESALARLKTKEITAPLIIVEIGGNDILGSTTTSQFAAALDALLRNLARADRQILMFELPLPPFYHEFGRIQRTMAAKYQVKLVPKRVFLSVLTNGDATLDSIHLSQSGHHMMAECVWQLVQVAYTSRSDE